jgi:trehalose-phosphatase
MKVLNSEINLDAFYAQLRTAPLKTLFLDYDGTLAPFHRDPGKAFPYPGVRERLDRIMQAPDIRLVIISGRWIKDLMPLLGLQVAPEIWGSHGIERLKPDGSYEIAHMEEDALHVLVAADEWVEAIGLVNRAEKKPGCLAVHWRGLSEEKVCQIRDNVLRKWSLIAEATGLRLKEFDGGVEIRVAARDKGDAVDAVLRETGPSTMAVYLGDDTPDEDAFHSIKGRGIGILVRSELRSTAADVWISPPGELLEFLSSWVSGSHRPPSLLEHPVG